MRKKLGFLFFITCIFALTFFVSCATFPKEEQPAQQSNLTFGVVKSKIIKGQTTQAEILEIFGSPNITTKNRDNDEVWNYSRMSYKTAAGADGGSVILFGGSRAMSTATTASFDLIIIFDKEDRVKDYSVISAKF